MAGQDEVQARGRTRAVGDMRPTIVTLLVITTWCSLIRALVAQEPLPASSGSGEAFVEPAPTRESTSRSTMTIRFIRTVRWSLTMCMIHKPSLCSIIPVSPSISQPYTTNGCSLKRCQTGQASPTSSTAGWRSPRSFSCHPSTAKKCRRKIPPSPAGPPPLSGSGKVPWCCRCPTRC